MSTGDSGQGYVTDAQREVGTGELDTGETDVPWIADAPLDEGDDVPGVDAAVDGERATCPAEMAQLREVCVDRWEASRADATGTLVT